MTAMDVSRTSLASIIRTVLATLAVLLLISTSLWIASPFIAGIVWGAIIAISVYPAYRRLSGWLGGRRGLSACVMGLGLAIVLFLPLAVLILTISNHVGELTAMLTDGRAMIPPDPPIWFSEIPLLGQRLELAWHKATVDVAGTIESLRPRIRELIIWLLSKMLASTLMLFEAAYAIILASIFIANASRLNAFFTALIGRLGANDAAAIVATTERTTRSVSKGILGTAFIQAVLAWIGFMVVGAPGPVLLAFFCFILCAIQLGIMLVGIPVAIWLWSAGQWELSIFIVFWSIFVSVIDSALKPILLGQDFPVPIWVLFMGIIGGMLTMGLVGLFIGPIILSVSYQLMLHWAASGETALKTGRGAEQ